MATRAGRRREGRAVSVALSVAAAGFVLLTVAGGGREGAAGAAGTTTTSATTTSTTTTSTTVPATMPLSVSLNGAGSYDVSAELVAWQNALYGKSGALNMNYVQLGSRQGRDAIFTDPANTQFTVSGVPYTDAELATFKAKASDLIAAPIMPDAVGFLLDPPSGGFYTVSGSTGNYSPYYTGPVKVPADNLAAQELNFNQVNQPNPTGTKYAVGGQASTPYGNWDNPNIIENWSASFLAPYDPESGNPDAFVPQYASPQNVQQAEASEQTMYLEQWAADAAPTIWSGLGKVYDPTYATDPSGWAPSEQVQPRLPVTEAAGLTGALQAIEDGGLSGNANTSGAVGAVPPSALEQALQFQANNIAACKLLKKTTPSSTCATTAPPAGQNYEWISTQNANGDWVTPSAKSIDAGIDASPAPDPTATTGVTPLWGATNKVAGAYPVTYVDYLYAPAKGLTIAQTEAMATMIRYLVTDGQSALAPAGDGQLDPTLVAQALASANQIVTSNCTAAGGVVTKTAAAGPYAPSTPKLQALPPQEHCGVNAPPPVTTTTTAPATTTTVPVTTTTAAPTTTTTVPLPASGGGTSGGATGGGATSGASGGGSPVTTVAPSAPTTTVPRTASSTGTGRSGTRKRTGTTAPPRTVIQAATASALPLGVATNAASGLDKPAALAIGAGGYLLLRRRVGAALRRLFGT